MSKTRMKTPLSPCDIEVLIWCHCRPGAHERFDAPAVHEAIRMFLDCGMVYASDSVENAFYTTTKGKAMIESLCNTMEPKCAWVDDRGKPLVFIPRGEEQ